MRASSTRDKALTQASPTTEIDVDAALAAEPTEGKTVIAEKELVPTRAFWINKHNGFTKAYKLDEVTNLLDLSTYKSSNSWNKPASEKCLAEQDDLNPFIVVTRHKWYGNTFTISWPLKDRAGAIDGDALDPQPKIPFPNEDAIVQRETPETQKKNEQNAKCSEKDRRRSIVAGELVADWTGSTLSGGKSILKFPDSPGALSSHTITLSVRKFFGFSEIFVYNSISYIWTVENLWSNRAFTLVRSIGGRTEAVARYWSPTWALEQNGILVVDGDERKTGISAELVVVTFLVVLRKQRQKTNEYSRGGSSVKDMIVEGLHKLRS